MMRRIQRAGWPVLVGSLAVLIGMVLLAAGFYVRHDAARLIAEVNEAVSDRSAAKSNDSASDGTLPNIPPYDTHLDDLRVLFAVADEQDVTLGPIDYRSEVNASLPILARNLEVRVNEEYPKLKLFIAALLRELPHMYLDEIQVEQAAPAAAKVQASLKLSFVYQKPEVPPARAPDVRQIDASTGERFSGAVARNSFGALTFADEEETAQVAVAMPVKTAPAPPQAVSTPVVPPPPPAPMAPPLPFVAVGAIQGTEVTGGQLVAFIRQQDKLLLVRAGESIGTVYRVEAINPQRIEFMYLPLMQRQSLALAP